MLRGEIAWLGVPPLRLPAEEEIVLILEAVLLLRLAVVVHVVSVPLQEASCLRESLLALVIENLLDLLRQVLVVCLLRLVNSVDLLEDQGVQANQLVLGVVLVLVLVHNVVLEVPVEGLVLRCGDIVGLVDGVEIMQGRVLSGPAFVEGLEQHLLRARDLLGWLLHLLPVKRNVHFADHSFCAATQISSVQSVYSKDALRPHFILLRAL